MQKRALLFISILVIVLTLLAGCGAKQPESALLRMMRFIPDRSAYRQWVSFGDTAAWHTSWDIPRIDNLDEVDNLDEGQGPLVLSTQYRQTGPSNTLGSMYLLLGEQRDFYGFDLFNLDRWIEAGKPPEMITAVEFGFDKGRIAEALEDSGYDDEELDGGATLYSILDDYEMAFDFPVRTGQTGNLNRIALLQQQMVIAKATELVKDALEANSGERRSLAENEEFRAAAAALQHKTLAEYGELVGVFLTDDQTFSDPATYVPSELSREDAQELSERLEREAGDLPGWEVVAFATQHAGDASYLTLALVFREGTDADSAAEVLADRLVDYESLIRRDMLMDYCRCSLESATAVEVEGLPVALVTLRADNPPPTPEDQAVWNTFVFNWWEQIMVYDTGFLMSD